MKTYVSDVIGNDYQEWCDGKVIISTPCASGKTTFILKELLPYYRKLGKKMLMVCNRLALVEQYKKALYDTYESKEEVAGVDFVTYQALGSAAYGKDQLPSEYLSYKVICFDEVHALVEEDYNPTYYNLFQIICNTLQHKCLIFMSATLDRMEGYLVKLQDQWQGHEKYFNEITLKTGNLPSWAKFFWYNNIPTDYSYIEMIGVQNERQLCACILEDVLSNKGQALIFSERKKQISDLKEMLLADTGMKRSQIMDVNSQRMNDGSLNSERTEMLNAERFPEGVDVILSTKVLV